MSTEINICLKVFVHYRFVIERYNLTLDDGQDLMTDPQSFGFQKDGYLNCSKLVVTIWISKTDLPRLYLVKLCIYRDMPLILNAGTHC